MQSLIERISFMQPGFWDLVQIVVVAYLFYRLLLLWAGTRAIQMLAGLIVLFAVYALAEVLQLELIRYLLQAVFIYGPLAAIVIFQPELRSALTRLGQSRFWRYFSRPQASSLSPSSSGPRSRDTWRPEQSGRAGTPPHRGSPRGRQQESQRARDSQVAPVSWRESCGSSATPRRPPPDPTIFIPRTGRLGTQQSLRWGFPTRINP